MNLEEEVSKAVTQFYDAIEELFVSGDTEPMKRAWHHTPQASSSHPFGPWVVGWEEIWETWREFAHMANPENKGMSLQNLKIYLMGEVAYTTGVFISSASFGKTSMNVSNVLQRLNGEWRIVHHHADKTPSLEAELNKFVEQGGAL